MGDNISVIYKHSFSLEQIFELPRILNELWKIKLSAPKFQTFFLTLSDYTQKKWVWCPDPLYKTISEEMENSKHLSLIGPNGFHGTIGLKIIEINHSSRFYYFANGENFTEYFMEIFKNLAIIFDSSKLILIPSSGFKVSLASDFVFEGRSFDEIEVWLLRNFGKPPLELKEVLIIDKKTNLWTDCRYFIEKI